MKKDKARKMEVNEYRQRRAEVASPAFSATYVVPFPVSVVELWHIFQSFEF